MVSVVAAEFALAGAEQFQFRTGRDKAFDGGQHLGQGRKAPDALSRGDGQFHDIRVQGLCWRGQAGLRNRGLPWRGVCA